MDDLLSKIAEESGDFGPAAGDPEVQVGDHVRQFREARGITLQQLAEKTGFSAALLSQIENRMVSPPLGTLVKIANAFDSSFSREKWRYSSKNTRMCFPRGTASTTTRASLITSTPPRRGRP